MVSTFQPTEKERYHLASPTAQDEGELVQSMFKVVYAIDMHKNVGANPKSMHRKFTFTGIARSTLFTKLYFLQSIHPFSWRQRRYYTIKLRKRSIFFLLQKVLHVPQIRPSWSKPYIKWVSSKSSLQLRVSCKQQSSGYKILQRKEN